jgi:uncharacterized cysteine cluster protein YcgN (CxxCxxCC family)
MKAELVRKHMRSLAGRLGGDLEGACTHCGSCCHPVVFVNGVRIVVKAIGCRFLARGDDGKSRCTVYDERAAKAPWCMDLRRGLKVEVFPDDCPYVEGLDRYKGPEVLNEFRYGLVEGLLRDAMKEDACPPWADPAAWEAFVKR